MCFDTFIIYLSAKLNKYLLGIYGSAYRKCLSDILKVSLGLSLLLTALLLFD